MMRGRHAVLCLVAGVFASVAVLAAGQARDAGSTTAGRVVLISLDGLGTRTFLDDPVADELQALRALRARGTMADGLVPHMPSTTANTHAALWTGAWGDVNGITSNDMPLAPRRTHRATQRVSGYRSDGLRAEPIWVAAARQGVPTVAQQATQVFPLRDLSSGADLAVPPVILHGYQVPVVAPARWLSAADVARVPCEAADGEAVVCLAWQAGPVPLRAAVLAQPAEARALRIRAAGQSASVLARHAPTEDAMPRHRALARRLLVDLPGVPPVMAYFRLFELSPDASTLVLFQSGLRPVIRSGGSASWREDDRAWLASVGGFVGNGHAEPWDAVGISGTPLWMGGDGTRERRYLETVELGIRQTIRQADALWRLHAPRLFVGYVSMPDEMEHAWVGLASQDARYAPLRRWGYQLVDRAVTTYVGFTTEADSVVFVSDHGMTAITHDVHVNHVLRDAGLVAVDEHGRVDAARSQVLFGRNCLLVHTTDWQGGVVPPDARDEVLARAVAALRTLPAIVGIHESAADRERLGFGGENGFDACVDLAPGHMASTRIDQGPVVRRRTRAGGDHGYLPTRRDMQGILIAAGPRLPAGGRLPTQRAIDVAPFVSDLLRIDPPRDARGRSLLAGGW